MLSLEWDVPIRRLDAELSFEPDRTDHGRRVASEAPSRLKQRPRFHVIVAPNPEAGDRK